MKHLRFYFDVVSPFAYLAFKRLPQALDGLSCSVDYQPVLFAGMLSRHGQKGPAEIEPKRAWTFRHVHWLAHRHRIEMQTPARHPFNPLPLLRLALACAPEGRTPGRHVCEQIFRHAWRSGADTNDPGGLSLLTQRLAPRLDPQGDEVKRMLKAATDAAIDDGVFGVPTIGIDSKLFWGLDSLDMVRACLQGDPWFEGPAWEREGAPREGVKRFGAGKH
jgi:2-hydroxychromene-2-carboxylate isomerase